VQDASSAQVCWTGIGQHKDQINPCGFLTFLGAVAGQGTGPLPYVVETVSAGEKVTYRAEPEYTETLLSRETAAILTEYMGLNVTEKYGAEHFPGFTVCAKSGTAEVGGDMAPNAMFAGFLQDPEYPLAFVIAIQEGGFGADTCVPVLASILEKIGQ
jgi:peptidoglycan glycosyltransferase